MRPSEGGGVVLLASVKNTLGNKAFTRWGGSCEVECVRVGVHLNLMVSFSKMFNGEVMTAGEEAPLRITTF